MHGIGLDMPLHSWFDFKTPRTLIPRNYIKRCLDTPDFSDDLSLKRYVWIGPTPRMKTFESKKKGKTIQNTVLQFNTLSEHVEIQCNSKLGNWIYSFLRNKEVNNIKINKLELLKLSFESNQLVDFERFFHSSTFAQLRDLGMLVL